TTGVVLSLTTRSRGFAGAAGQRRGVTHWKSSALVSRDLFTSMAECARRRRPVDCRGRWPGVPAPPATPVSTAAIQYVERIALARFEPGVVPVLVVRLEPTEHLGVLALTRTDGARSLSDFPVQRIDIELRHPSVFHDDPAADNRSFD